jgi:hypothetical protein
MAGIVKAWEHAIKFQISLFAWQIVEEGKKEEGAAQQFGPGPNGWVPIFNFLYLTVVFVSLSYFSNFFFFLSLMH